MGHLRRFSRTEASRLLDSQGFQVEKAWGFNKPGAPPWWLYSRVLGSRHINKPVLKIFDKSVWLLSRLDPWLPWPALSLVLVARKQESGGGEPVAGSLASQIHAD
jgi:hypothetical protein